MLQIIRYILKYKILHILVKKVIYYSNIYKRWRSLCFKLEKKRFLTGMHISRDYKFSASFIVQ